MNGPNPRGESRSGLRGQLRNGAGSALALAGRGAAIAASARTSEALDGLLADIRAAGGRAEAFPADVEDPKQARSAVEAIVHRFGRIDIFVYATGTNIPGRAAEVLSAEDWDMMQRTNLGGLYHTVQSALETLRKSNARVVVISSARCRCPILRAWPTSRPNTPRSVSRMDSCRRKRPTASERP